MTNSARADRPVGTWQRIVLGAVIALASALLAGVAGMFVAGRCCVPEGSGLAGPGIVVGYGVLAGAGGLVLGMVLAGVLGRRALVRFSVVLGAGGAMVAVALLAALMDSAQQSAAALEQAYEQLPSFEIDIELDDGAPLTRFTADWSAREMVELRADGSSCRRRLVGKHAVRLLESLRAVEGVLLRDPQPCVEHQGPAVQTLRFLVEESLPPVTSAELTISEACLLNTPVLGAPLEAARRVLRAGGRCLP